MANEILKRDENRVTVLAGVTDDASKEIRMLRVDPATGRLKLSLSGIAVAATVDVGTTTTIASGEDATATNSGTTSAAVIDFEIPKGSTIYSTVTIPDNAIGMDGDWAFSTAVGSNVYYKSAGVWDLVNTNRGAASSVDAGTTTTGLAGTNASVVNSGTTTDAIFDFTIPRGDKGETGNAATATAGTTTNLSPGASATVVNAGTTSAAVFNFGIPEGLKGDKGDTGTAATATAGTTTTGAPNTNASVTNSGSTSAAVFDFTIPRGLDITWHGTYDAGHTYQVNDAVAYLGTSYIWINATPASGHTPADDTYWDILALKGDGDVNLDQTTPQTFINGRPTFGEGLKLGLTPSSVAHAIGAMYWDTDWKTPVVELEDDVRLQVGQETMAYVYNGTGSTIGQGKVVYTSGTQGGVASISLAQGDADATSSVLGLVTSTTIAPTEYGYVTIRGHVNNIDTSAWSLNDVLYLSSETAGMLTNVKPNTGNYDTIVGRVMLDDASTGRVYVNITREYATGVISGGSGIDFFLDDTSIIATSANNSYPVKVLSKVPVTTAEDVDTINVTAATSPVLYGEYLYAAGLGDTTIQGGVWTFDIYAGVNSATNTTSLTQNVYRVRTESGTVTIDNVVGTSARATASTGTPFAITKVDASADLSTCSYLMITNNTTGLYPITAITSDTVVTITVPAGYTPAAASTFKVQKKLFGITTGEINNVASAGTTPPYAGLQLYTVNTVQPAYTILSTDALGTKMFGVSTGTRDVYFSHNGTSRYSHFTSPLVTRHNDLAGIQGGATGDYVHLTTAQATIATQSATTDRSGYLTDTDWDTFNGKAPTTAASTSTAGLAPQATAPASGLYNYLGITNGETAYTNKALFNATSPSTQAFGDSAVVGTSANAARQDHKHQMMAAPTSVSGNAGTVTVAAETGDTSCSILFATDVSGSLAPKTNTNLTFNASTGVLTSASCVLTTADINGGTFDNATIGASTPSTIVGTTIQANTGFVPDANDGAYLGTTALSFSDLFLAEGGVINWDNGDLTLTQTGNSLALAGGSLSSRITPRIYTTASIAGAPGVLTPEIDTYDYFELTAQAAPLNIANHSTSTPVGGEKMTIAITSDATPRALTYGTAYVAKGGVALPSTTVASKTLTLGFIYNAGLTKWNLVAAAQEA